MNHLCVGCRLPIHFQINPCLMRRRRKSVVSLFAYETTKMVWVRHKLQSMCCHVTSKRIDCTMPSSNIAVDKVVAAAHLLNCVGPSMPWKNCCIHPNHWQCQLTPPQCRWRRSMYSPNWFSIGATECRLAFVPLYLATTSASLMSLRSELVSICIVCFETKFLLESLTNWAYAQVAHVQVPTNIAAAENDFPIRALVPERKGHEAFVCYEVFHFYAIHSATRSPLVGCSSLLGIKKKNMEIVKCDRFSL